MDIKARLDQQAAWVDRARAAAGNRPNDPAGYIAELRALHADGASLGFIAEALALPRGTIQYTVTKATGRN